MPALLRFVIAAALVVPALAVAPQVTHDTADAACGVSIYEIYYDSPGTDNGGNTSLNGEWIQLRNSCSSSVSLSGWKVKDAANHVYKKFGTYKLGGGAKVKIHTGKGTNKATDRYWGLGSYVWNNTGSETGKLINSAGTVVDTCRYTGGSPGYVYC
jgi:predicted extracellular nuclease